MSRRSISLVLALLALSLVAVPAALAKGGNHRAVRIHGVCTKQSTSKMKLTREDRGIEIEFQVDQNRNRVPWQVRLSRNGKTLASFTVRTRAPSGSFEIRRVVAGQLGTDRIKAVATRSSETCTADSAKPRAAASSSAAPDNGADDNGNDVGDDHGRHSGGHA
jgi:hypothetical protein